MTVWGLPDAAGWRPYGRHSGGKRYARQCHACEATTDQPAANGWMFRRQNGRWQARCQACYRMALPGSITPHDEAEGSTIQRAAVAIAIKTLRGEIVERQAFLDALLRLEARSDARADP